MSDSFAMPTRTVQFGDGYSERSPDGLSRAIEVWEVECAFASETAGANLQNFLGRVGGWAAFLWQSPRDAEPQMYIVVQPVGGSVRRGGGSKPYFYTRSLKFKRVYSGSIDFFSLVTFTYLDSLFVGYNTTTYLDPLILTFDLALYLDKTLIPFDSTTYLESSVLTLFDSTTYLNI